MRVLSEWRYSSAGAVWDLENSKPTFASPYPQILVATPSLISRVAKEFSVEEDFYEHIRHLVLDEVTALLSCCSASAHIALKADLLLDGDFLKQIEHILGSLKKARRRLISNGSIMVR